MTRIREHVLRRFERLDRFRILALAASGVVAVGAIDYAAGYEVSMSVFYLAPVAVAAWYAGRMSGVAIATMACISWFIADAATGHPYSNPAIPVWNALVRFGFFVINALLLTMLRNGLRHQQHLARTDSLTGLHNRRSFEDRLKHDLALAHRRKGALTLAYVDVDNFGAVNETHGHAGGDRVLRIIGQVLKDSLREGDTAARVGGDEFMLVLPDTDNRGARELIERLLRGLREALAESNWAVTCSIGVLTLVDAAISAEEAIAATDEVMYDVKRSGKGRIEFEVF